MALSPAFWANYTNGNVKLQRKSEKAVAADRVLQFKWDAESSTVIGWVQASMRDQSYRVQVYLDESNWKVLHSSCGCALQEFVCHHIAAVLLFGYKNVSKTDVPATWIRRPKSARPRETKTILQMFPVSRPDYSALGSPVTDQDRAFMFQKFAKLGRFTAIHWILAPEPQKDQVSPVPTVEDLMLSEQFISRDRSLMWLREQLQVSPSTIERVVNMTQGQGDNIMWSVIRKMRFTSSNFGPLLSAAKNKRLSASLKKKLLSTYNLDKVSAVSWGIIHEETARAAYTSLGAKVALTGLWLHNSGVLGASPDGLILKPPTSTNIHYQTADAGQCLPGLLEIKCPYAAKDMSVEDAASSLKDFCLGSDCGRLFLKNNHQYYHQIQGQLHITKTQCCDLVIWTTKDLQIIRIALDKMWEPNLTKLTDFYFQMFIPSFLE